MIETEQTRTAIAQAVQAASLGTVSFVSTHRDQLAACTPSTRERLIVQAAITYLFANRLVEAVDNGQEWLTLEIPEPFAGDLVAAVDEGVEQQRRINAAINFEALCPRHRAAAEVDQQRGSGAAIPR